MDRVGLGDSDRSLENVPDEDDLQNNSLFDNKNMMFRMGAVSEIKTKVDR